MIKNMLLGFILLFSHIAIRAEDLTMPPMVDGRFIYTQIVPAENTTKNGLYNRAKLFLALQFRSAPDVIKLDNKDSGTILAKGFFKAPFMLISVDIWFSVKIEVKDNKYRVTVTDLERGAVDGDSSTGFLPLDQSGRFIKSNGKPRMGWGNTFDSTNKHIVSMLDSLKTSMTTKSSATDF